MTKLNGGAWSSTHKHAYRSRRSAAPLTEAAVVVNTTSSPSRTNHTGTTCGLPSLRTVATLAVRVPSSTNACHSCSVMRRISREATPLPQHVGPTRLRAPLSQGSRAPRWRATALDDHRHSSGALAYMASGSRERGADDARWQAHHATRSQPDFGSAAGADNLEAWWHINARAAF